MRILFENKLKDASIRATNTSLNYPPTNLTHQFLRKRFQPTGFTSVITIEFTSNQSMNCLFYAYHKLTGLSALYKDAGGSTLLSFTVSEINDIGVEYFTLLTDVRTIEISVTGSSNYYLGGLGGGVYYQMPNVLASYTPDFVDNSVSVSSSYGQVLTNSIVPLRQLAYNIREISPEITKEIIENFLSIGTFKPVYVDLYEGDRTKEEPIYGYFTDSLGFPYNPRVHTTAFTIREAR